MEVRYYKHIAIFIRTIFLKSQFYLVKNGSLCTWNIICATVCDVNVTRMNQQMYKFFFSVLYKNICAQRKEKRLHPRIIYIYVKVFMIQSVMILSELRTE